MSRVIHFEINADNPQSAVDFYQNVFNWRIEKWEGPIEYWLAYTGDDSKPGINGAIMKRLNPNTSVINTIEVESIDDTIEKIISHGGTVVKSKSTIPNVGYVAYFSDTEGNVSAVFEPIAKEIK